MTIRAFLAGRPLPWSAAASMRPWSEAIRASPRAALPVFAAIALIEAITSSSESALTERTATPERERADSSRGVVASGTMTARSGLSERIFSRLRLE
jgi:hypothetical protein